MEKFREEIFGIFSQKPWQIEENPSRGVYLSGYAPDAIINMDCIEHHHNNYHYYYLVTYCALYTIFAIFPLHNLWLHSMPILNKCRTIKNYLNTAASCWFFNASFIEFMFDASFLNHCWKLIPCNNFSLNYFHWRSVPAERYIPGISLDDTLESRAPTKQPSPIFKIWEIKLI